MPTERAVHGFLPRLMEGRWFAHLGEGLRAGLIEKARIVLLAPRERLFGRGEIANGLYAVLDGAIEIGAYDSEGQPAVLTIVETATWFGEIAIVDGLARTHDATAIRRSTVLHVPHRAIVALLDREPMLWRELGRLLAEKLRLAFEAAEANSRRSAAQRLAARLVMIAEGYGGAAVRQQQIGISQDQLSLLLSLSRQTVNRILKDLEAGGIVGLRQGHIELRDLAALRRLA